MRASSRITAGLTRRRMHRSAPKRLDMRQLGTVISYFSRGEGPFCESLTISRCHQVGKPKGSMPIGVGSRAVASVKHRSRRNVFGVTRSDGSGEKVKEKEKDEKMLMLDADTPALKLLWDRSTCSGTAEAAVVTQTVSPEICSIMRIFVVVIRIFGSSWLHSLRDGSTRSTPRLRVVVRASTTSAALPRVSRRRRGHQRPRRSRRR